MSLLKDAAVEYAKQGWPVFPCRANKQPYTDDGVLEATTDKTKINEWWTKWPTANIGFHVGEANLVVLDLDPGHSLKELEQNLGELPLTKLRSTTPRGGQHLFYEKKQGEIIAPSASKIAKNVDVRSFHSYVLLPPSRTADGEYAWASKGKPSFRPDKLVELANSHREKHEDRDNWLIKPDLQENIDLCINWLKNKAQIAIEGVNGDQMAYNTAAMCKSYGISPETAFELMWEHWNPRCSPPWAADQIEHLQAKIENGYSYNTSPPGNVTPAYKTAKAQSLFKPVKRATAEGGKEIKGGRFRIVDRSGMEDIKPPTWLVKDLLPENGFGLLIGPRGTFKTFLALDIALSIATGASKYFEDGSWLGPWPDVTNPGPVLFAAGEGRSGMMNRVRAWERHHIEGDKVKNFFLMDPVPGPNVDDVTAFIETALEMNENGYRLTVLDTVGRSMQGLNENSQQDASMFTRMVQDIQAELNCAVLALHHTGHGSEYRARGSSVFGADVDSEFVLTRKDKEHTILVRNTKQKDAPEWEEPRVIQLIEPKGIKSLVAVKPTKAAEAKAIEEAPAEKTGKGKRSSVEIKLELKLVRDTALKVLKTYPAKEFSKRALADAIAADDQIEITADPIRRRYLAELTADKAHPISKCYDVGRSVWVFHPSKKA